MKTCFVLEGGALRGIYTAGVLDELMNSGISVDAFIGVSMGALIGINYCSNQPKRALRYNLKYCRDKRFISLASLFKTGNIANKDFDYYEIPDKLDPFDYDVFKKSPVNFYCVVTNLDTGKAEYIEIDDAKEKVEYLRASSSMPGLSRIVEIDGGKYLDGGVADSIPVYEALRRGYDKVVVVTTRPISYRKRKSKMKTLSTIYRKYPNFVKTIQNRNTSYNKTVEDIIELEKNNKIFVIRPSKYIPIKRVEKNPKMIQAQYDLGVSDFHNCLCDLEEFLNS